MKSIEEIHKLKEEIEEKIHHKKSTINFDLSFTMIFKIQNEITLLEAQHQIVTFILEN